ncbi:hypothetical protein CRENBAI_003693 [Crenichthys baileyi]|uniref:Uncharacterized protein n=1 Tax=Crenichthys baileyi TaxID=28760 RepID=A0AAV9QQT5_9TELE
MEEQRSPFWGSRLAIPPPGTGPRCHKPCVAEKGFIQARRGEEQLSPFWGTRLAISLPGTSPRRYTLAPSSSSEPVFGTAHFLCPVRESSTPPPQSSSSSSRRRRRSRQGTVPPVMEIRTGASISLLEGLANTPSSCLASSTSLPGSQPCCSDHPMPPCGSRQKNMANTDSPLQSKAVEDITSRSLSRPSTQAWVLSGLAAVRTALVPVPDSTEGSADAPALVSTGVQPEAPAPVSAGSPLLPVQPPTSPPASAISEGSADTPASVSAGVQQDAPAFISAGGQPDISEPAALPPDQPPFTSTQPAHLLGFLWGILSEISCVPASVPVLVSSAASPGPPVASLGSPAASQDTSRFCTASQDTCGFCTALPGL